MKNNHKKKYNFISNIPFELLFFCDRQLCRDYYTDQIF